MVEGSWLNVVGMVGQGKVPKPVYVLSAFRLMTSLYSFSTSKYTEMKADLMASLLFFRLHEHIRGHIIWHIRAIAGRD